MVWQKTFKAISLETNTYAKYPAASDWIVAKVNTEVGISCTAHAWIQSTVFGDGEQVVHTCENPQPFHFPTVNNIGWDVVGQRNVL